MTVTAHIYPPAGPWTANGTQITGEMVSDDGSVKFPVIAVVDSTTARADENACLIAAAPELYTALDALYFATKYEDKYGIEQTMVNAHAAIWKANVVKR